MKFFLILGLVSSVLICACSSSRCGHISYSRVSVNDAKALKNELKDSLKHPSLLEEAKMGNDSLLSEAVKIDNGHIPAQAEAKYKLKQISIVRQAYKEKVSGLKSINERKPKYKKPFEYAMVALFLFSVISFFAAPVLFFVSSSFVYLAMFVLSLVLYSMNLKRRRADATHPDVDFSLLLFVLMTGIVGGLSVIGILLSLSLVSATADIILPLIVASIAGTAIYFLLFSLLIRWISS